MPRLLRCTFWKSLSWRGPPIPSPSSSAAGISILTTWAPQSASWRTAVGPGADPGQVENGDVRKGGRGEHRPSLAPGGIGPVAGPAAAPARP